ncbi:hypothetical protein AGMMS50276_06450 [Synergistales bacterium]|nr:hypothetical protein AGMMS50276_06450 [Synergistales bacterium]
MPENTQGILKEFREALESESLLTARMVDSVLRTNQLASLATPEMLDMFGQWLSLVGTQVLREIEEKSDGSSECDVVSLARAIGVSDTTIFSILLSLHRAGKIRVDSVRFSKGDGRNAEVCSCLT